MKSCGKRALLRCTATKSYSGFRHTPAKFDGVTVPGTGPAPCRLALLSVVRYSGWPERIQHRRRISVMHLSKRHIDRQNA